MRRKRKTATLFVPGRVKWGTADTFLGRAPWSSTARRVQSSSRLSGTFLGLRSLMWTDLIFWNSLPVAILGGSWFGPNQHSRNWIQSTDPSKKLRRRRMGTCCPVQKWLMLIWLGLSTPTRFSQWWGRSKRRWRGHQWRRTRSRTWILCWSWIRMQRLQEGWRFWLRHNGSRPSRRSLTRRGNKFRR